VLLKHPGAVPTGAGVAGSGWFGGLFVDPGKWHFAQTGAFVLSVFVWVNGEPRHGLRACGEATSAPWHAALLRHVGAMLAPAKLFPWQIWQEANPELPGASLAVAPCTAAVLQFGIGPW
jgi:hypothetical protein